MPPGPTQPAPRWRLPLMIAGLLAAVALFALQQSAGGGLAALPMQDYVEYWAAGRLLARGDNPYDAEAIAALERAAGRTEEGILMWNPPWAMPLVVPLGWLEARTGHLPWLAFQFAALLAAAALLARVYGVPGEHRLTLVALLFTFVPAAAALIAGQISPLMLLGAAAFLALVRQRRDGLAGVAASLIGIKPHLAVLFWVALLAWTLRTRRWGVIAGGLAAGLALAATAVAFRPGILAEYWHTLRHAPPSQYVSPTIGTLLRKGLGDDRFGLQFVPVLPGLAWLAWFGWRHRRDWDWPRHLPAVLLGSMLTAAYGAWLFDLTVLFVVVAHLAAGALHGPPRRRKAALALHAAINLVAVVQVCLGGQYLYFIWLTPALIAALVLLGDRRTSPRPAGHATGTPSPA